MAGESELDEVLAAHYAAVDAGGDDDWRALPNRYPHLAEEIRTFFENEEKIYRFREPAGPGHTNPSSLGTPTLFAGQRPSSPSSVPANFGGYELLGEIARGGMGVVYKAKQLQALRIVALKMVLAGAALRPEERQRFQLEASAAAALDHPNIVPIYDVGEVDGQLYFTMKLIEGGNLAALREKLHDEFRVIARLMAEIARAVHFAHLHGIIHRDLKPANILLQEVESGSWNHDDRFAFVPYVTDFGLAKRVSDESDLTQSGAIVGTPNYMSPEQAAGQKNLTVATDVYSLGAILYEMLTGSKPFQGDTPMATVLMVQSLDPAAPQARNAKVPVDLSVICLKCLEKQPHRRYASAEELASDLERWLGGQPILARPISRAERVVKWIQRRKAVAAMLLMLVILSVCSAATVLWQWREAVVARREADLRAESEREAKEDLKRLLARERLAVYRGELSSAQLLQIKYRPGDAQNILDNIPQGERGWEWHYLHRVCYMSNLPLFGGNKDKIERVQTLGCCVALSPDGSTTATGNSDGSVTVCKSNSGLLCFSRKLHDDAVLAIAFDAGGRQLTSIGSRKAVVCDLAGIPAGQLEAATGEGFVGGCAAAESNQVWLADTKGIVQLWHTGEQRICREFKSKSGRITSVSCSPNGLTLAAAHDDGSLRVWELATGKILLSDQRHKGKVLGVCCSRDGALVATTGADGQVRLWNNREAGSRVLFTQKSAIRCASFSFDDKRLAVGGDRYFGIWHVGNCMELFNPIFSMNPTNFQSLSFGGPHDNLIVCGREEKGGNPGSAVIRVLQAPKQTIRSFSHDSEILAPLGFTSDSSWLLTARRGRDGTIASVRAFATNSDAAHSFEPSNASTEVTIGRDAFAVYGERQLEVSDLGSNTVRLRLDNLAPIRGAALGKNADELALADQEEVRLYNLKGVVTGRRAVKNVRRLQSDNDSYIAFRWGGDRVEWLRLDDPDKVHSLTMTEPGIVKDCFHSEDRTRLIVRIDLNGTDICRVWRIADRARLFSPRTELVECNGPFALTHSTSEAQVLADREDRFTLHLMRLLPSDIQGKPPQHIRLSPDSRWITWSDGQVLRLAPTLLDGTSNP